MDSRRDLRQRKQLQKVGECPWARASIDPATPPQVGVVAEEGTGLVERFTRGSDGIEYEVSLTDPTVWIKPWTAALTLARQPADSMFEYACHEGNNSMRNMLSASRAAEKTK